MLVTTDPALISLVISTTVSMFSSNNVSLSLFQSLISINSNDYGAIAEDVARRLHKVVDTAFYQDYVDKLKSAKQLFEDFSSNGDDSILDELHEKTSDLMAHFSRFTTVEAISNYIQAHTIYILIMKYKYEKNYIQKDLFIKRGQEYADALNESFKKMENLTENSLESGCYADSFYGPHCESSGCVHELKDNFSGEWIYRRREYTWNKWKEAQTECLAKFAEIMGDRRNFIAELRNQVHDAHTHFSNLEVTYGFKS